MLFIRYFRYNVPAGILAHVYKGFTFTDTLLDQNTTMSYEHEGLK